MRANNNMNDLVVAHADATIAQIIDTMLRAGERGVVIGEAPAGAGKSYAIGTAVLEARKAGRRVAVATPTNEQAYSLMGELGRRVTADLITFIPGSKRSLPVAHRSPHVREAAAKDTASHPILVGTLDKLGDAFSRGDIRPVDLLMIDEAFQANSVKYYAVGGLAPCHLLMGDRGQLAPFSTAAEGHRWRGLDEDPLLTAVEVIRRNHPSTTTTFKLPITRRLDPRGARVAKAFYPGHPFEAAVRDGVRKLVMKPKSRGNRQDRILDLATESGWAHVELPGTSLAIADPTTIQFIVALVRRTLAREPTIACESIRKPKRLEQDQIAVAVSHNDQKNFLRVALAEAGLAEVVVETANKLQGLTYALVIAWHPLAGLTDVDEFHLDPGRLCVMLTRHRHACIVIGREADRQLVEGIPPSSPAYFGYDGNPALDGWYAHESVFDALRDYRVAG